MAGTSSARRVTGTDQVVRRAARRIGIQAGAAVALVVVGLSVVALVLAGRAQHDADADLVRQTAAVADDVGDPPPSCWIVLLGDDGKIHATKGLPASVLDVAALRAAAGSGAVTEAEARDDDGHYLRRTEPRPDGAVQVVLDLGPSDRRLAMLVAGLVVAAGIGLLLAGVIGWVLAKRILAPLTRTLTLQRQFVADASHELRTPLTLLHTRLQLLHQGLTADDDRTQAVEDASALLRDSDRMVELVDDLLIAADPLTEPEPQPVAIDALVDDVVDATRPHAERRRLELTGSAQGEPVVRGSAPALRRALLAMLDNAIEHTPPGGAVTVSAQSLKNAVRIEVADNGTGLDATKAGQLFDRFHSGEHGTRRRHGLGLALVSDVVDRHGGRIEVHGEPGQGTRFVLTFPHHR